MNDLMIKRAIWDKQIVIRKDDTISRQLANEAIKRAIWDKQTAKDAIDAVCNIPSAQQWIPVSEGLPEYKVQVLAIDKDGDYELNHIVDEEDGEWYWGHPIAWMPIPEYYKGES